MTTKLLECFNCKAVVSLTKSEDGNNIIAEHPTPECDAYVSIVRTQKDIKKFMVECINAHQYAADRAPATQPEELKG